MKKILLFASALAGLFLAASCQKENFEPTAGTNTVKFTVEAPGALATKASTINEGATIADGTNVNEVHYAVYKTNSGVDYSIDDSGEIDGPLAQGVVPMSNKKANINFDLLQDQEYTVIFWAQVEGAGHYELGDLRTIKVATSVVGNDETRAAFYARYDFETYEHKDHKVTLRRPFAQLNLLTTAESLTPVQTGQSTGYTIDVKTSEVMVEGLSNTFNTLTGLAPEGTDKFRFVMAETPEEQGQETLVVNGKAYHYVSMNYFFVPQDEALVNINYTLVTDKGNVYNEIPAVPVKENYRTNVIGNLLTKESKFEIIVDADFYGQKLVEVWDQREVSEPAKNTAGEYMISTASELAWLSAAVNGTLPVVETKATEVPAAQTFEGKTFVLVEDIDLQNALWTPIGATGKFLGTFDGKGRTISNLKVNCTDKTPVGLFANAKYVRNVIVKNAEVKGHYMAGVIVGDGLCSRIDNCHVAEASVVITTLNNDDANHAGGIVGYLSAENEAYVKNSSVVNSTISAYRDVAGIAGTANQAAVVANCSVENVTVIADQTSDYVDVKAANAGQIAGRVHAKAVLDGNTWENTVVKILGAADSDLLTAINDAKEGDTVYVGGDYGKFPSVGKAVTIVCEEGTTFYGNSKLNLHPEATVIGATFSNQGGTAVDQTITGTFKNCTFTGSNAVRWGYSGEVCVFEDCVFDGSTYGFHTDGGANPITFIRCTFSGFNAFASEIPMLTFDGCTFKANGKSNYNGANLWGSAKFINTEFVFDGSVENEWVDAIGKDNTYEFTGCTINGGSIFNSDYVSSRNNGTKMTIDGVEYTYTDGYFATADYVVATTPAAFRNAIEKESTIKLADGVYEGLYYVNGKSLNIEALNEGHAKINGKLGIAASGKTVNVKGLVFENSYAGSVAAGHQYLDKTGKYCIGLYCASVNVEDCTFNLSDNGAINFYAVNAPERCTVKNSTFNCNGFRPILSKADVTVDGCTFNDQYKYALQVWGNANTGNESVVFINNTINKPGVTSACADVYRSYVSVSGSYELANVAFTISGNTPGYNFVYDNKPTVNMLSCSLNGKQIVEGQCFPAASDINEVLETPAYAEVDGAYELYSAKGLYWFADQVNVAKNAFNGKTVKLGTDIDLANAVWTPVGQTGETTFNGVFDGQNHTISNLNVNSDDKTGAYYSSGLFGWVETHSEGKGQIKNVKIDGATVVGHHNCGALVGYITEKYAVVDNCHVSNATISCTYANGDADGDKAGALIGNATNATKVNACSAVDCTVSAGRDSGQLIGAAKSDNVTDCSATNVTVSANGTGTGKNIRNEVIGRLL